MEPFLGTTLQTSFGRENDEEDVLEESSLLHLRDRPKRLRFRLCSALVCFGAYLKCVEKKTS